MILHGNEGDSMHRFFAVIVSFMLFSFSVFGQSSGPRVVQISEVLNNDTVTLTAFGNGDSSGFAVDGNLRNNTQNRIIINTLIEDGIYLKNSGKGQNMLAIQVFLSDGGYFSDGKNYFITVPAQGNIDIVFNAFCADFGLDNPVSADLFSISSIPAAISGIASKISKYAADIFDSDYDATKAMQLALWRTQGNTRAEILKKFYFNDETWELSTVIMNSR